MVFTGEVQMEEVALLEVLYTSRQLIGNNTVESLEQN